MNRRRILLQFAVFYFIPATIIGVVHVALFGFSMPFLLVLMTLGWPLWAAGEAIQRSLNPGLPLLVLLSGAITLRIFMPDSTDSKSPSKPTPTNDNNDHDG